MTERRDDPAKMAAMKAWLEAVCAELGISMDILTPVQKDLLHLISEVAHGPSRPGAPMTAYLVGMAAAGDPQKASEHITKITQLVEKYQVAQS